MAQVGVTFSVVVKIEGTYDEVVALANVIQDKSSGEVKSVGEKLLKQLADEIKAKATA